MNRKAKLFAFLFILLGSFVVYGNTLGHDFVWDDLILIVDSDALRKWANLGAFFTTPFFKLAANMDFPHHRPMVPLMILLASTLTGTNPIGYHLLNVVLHALVTWLLFLFFEKISLKPAVRIFSTAIFLFHPVHVEVVAWPCSAAVLAGAAFFLAALLYSETLKKVSGDRRAFSLLGVGFCYGAGLLSYDLVLTLPAVILLYDYVKPYVFLKEKPWRLRITEIALLSFLAIDFLWMRYSLANSMGGFARFQHGDVNATNIILQGGFRDSVLAVFNALSRYMESLLFPWTLSPEAYFRAEQLSISALGCLVLFIGGTFFVFKNCEGKKPFSFSVGWMLVTLLPLAQLIFQGGLFADRYLYFASMGFALWLAIALESIWKSIQSRWSLLSRNFAICLAVFLCLVYGIKTFTQNKIWRDDLAFWTAASTLSPEKPRAHHLLGVSLLRFGYPEEAMKSFQKAIKLSPFYPHPYKGIAIALRELGKAEEADRADFQADQMYEMQIRGLQARGAARKKP